MVPGLERSFSPSSGKAARIIEDLRDQTAEALRIDALLQKRAAPTVLEEELRHMLVIAHNQLLQLILLQSLNLSFWHGARERIALSLSDMIERQNRIMMEFRQYHTADKLIRTEPHPIHTMSEHMVVNSWIIPLAALRVIPLAFKVTATIMNRDFCRHC